MIRKSDQNGWRHERGKGVGEARVWERQGCGRGKGVGEGRVWEREGCGRGQLGDGAMGPWETILLDTGVNQRESVYYSHIHHSHVQV